MAAKTTMTTMTITTRMIMLMIRKLEVIQYIWNLRLYEEVGGCTQGSWRLYTRKLVVVHKEVKGCLMSYNLQLACLRKLQVIPLINCARIVASIALNDKL